ncbi:hypothetical protein H8B02_22815 [Bradyrhizobium sp. Pear77]|uniref:hypothetical protein n=1 Tax=Bradyrhizobium altum TaxID=1571202 RepID=UPI001E326A11|nr:hypothetical protein [Bradyrhizobium altum]MCC8956156.1 hypothetical protein [Bradyrhizobium altum]
MASRGKTFELLDFPKFAYPSVVGMDAVLTSQNVSDRLGGGGFMSYAAIWPRMAAIVGGHANDAFIEKEFGFYDEDWKNESIRDAVRLLRKHFGGRGTWYSLPTKPISVLGFLFKPSIKGIWFVDGRAYAVLINARKRQRLFPDHLRFLARGVYELHCIDDPNDPTPLIIDLSEHDLGEGRSLNVHEMPVESAISLDEFDAAVREFVKALELAGVARALPDGSIIDLFRKR